MIQNVILAFLLLLYSCVPGQESEVSVEGQSSIVNQVKVYSDVGRNIGDWSLETDPLEITLTMKNNSSKPITNIGVQLKKTGQIDGLGYKADQGLSVFPGYGGTCTSKLESGEDCTLKLELAPSESGRLKYKVQFNYKNLIGQESQSLEFSALAGTPASLVFENDVALYDLGIVEQVDDEPGIKRFPMVTTLVLVNKGELAARNIETILVSTNDQPTAFSVSRNDCPTQLKSLDTCEIDIAYNPLNQDINDPETIYQSSLSLRYGKDQKDKPATLTALFKSLSTKIVGRFERAGSQSICFKPDEESPCGPITAGNSGLSTFKVINRGFQDAILKTIVVSYKDMLVHCEPNGDNNLLCYEVGKILKYSTGDTHWYLNGGDSSVEFDQTGYTCNEVELDLTTHCVLDNFTKTQLSLYDFPFLLQDTDLCMTNETRVGGKDILNLGSEACEIGIKFHPPINFNKEGMVADGAEILEMPVAGTPPIEISVIYDSLWKDKVNTYVEASPPLFQAEPKAYSQAIVRVSRFSYGVLSHNYALDASDQQPGDSLVDYDETIFSYDLGRYAMVLDNTISVTGRIVLKNYGNTRAIINSIYTEHDGNIIEIPFKDGDVNLGNISKIDLGCGPSPEPFFRNVKSYCNQDEISGITYLDPDSTCEIRFNFTPVSETNKIHQNLCMFGIPINDARYDTACVNAPSSCNKIVDADKRKFGLVYDDGSMIEDDLVTESVDKEIKFHFDASLAASGKLQVGPLSSSNIPTFGQKLLSIEDTEPRSYKYGHIEIMNVGSNSVPYIYLQDDFNLNPFDYSVPEYQGLAFVESNEHPFITGGMTNSNGLAYKDCYYLIQNKPQDQLFGQFSNLYPEPTNGAEQTNFVNALDNYQGNPAQLVSFLDKGESCILTVRSKVAYGLQDSTVYNDVTFEDFTDDPNYNSISGFLSAFPLNHEDCDGTLESFRPDVKATGFSESEIKIFYFDNDTDTSNGAVPDNSEFGNLNYVYQNDDPLKIESDEGQVSVAYPILESYPVNAILRNPPKSFPGIDSTPLFTRAAQNTTEIFHFGTAGIPSGTYYNFGDSISFYNASQGIVEGLAGVDFDDFDQVLSLGALPDNGAEPYQYQISIRRENLTSDFLTMTYTDLYSEGSDGHKIIPTLDTTSGSQSFQVQTATDGTGYHVGVLEYSYKSNMKVEANRVASPCSDYTGNAANNDDSDTSYKMVDIDDPAKFDYVTVTKRILVFAKVYETADTPHLTVSTEDYEVCQDPSNGVISEDDPYDAGDDANCSAGNPAAGPTVHPTYLFNMANSNESTVFAARKNIEDIKGDDLYSKVRIKIQNSGSESLTFSKITASNNATAVNQVSGENVYAGTTENKFNKLDYGIVNSGAANHVPALPACSGTLASGDSCAMFVVVKANNALINDTNRWVTIEYFADSDRTKVVEKFPIRLIPLNPAQIEIEGFGTPISTIEDPSDDSNFTISDVNISRFRDDDYGSDWEQGTSVNAIRLPMGTITINQAPTHFQFHLKLTADSGALKAFIRQELFNVDTEGTDWDPATIGKVSNVSGNSRISIDYDPYSPIYPGEQTCANFHAGDASMNDNESCIIAINYFIDESFIEANATDNVNGHEGTYIEFCNNYQGSNPSSCSTERIYFAFTGDINFANARTVSGNDLVFDGIEANDSGIAYFEWDAVVSNANWSNSVTDYILRYGNSEKTLSVLEGQGNASVGQRWVRMTNLVPGNYYDVELVPIVDSQFSNEDYEVEFNQGEQKVKFLVPDDGLTYFHDQELLVKVLSDKQNYVNIEDECNDSIKVGANNVPMNVMTTNQYSLLLSLNFPGVNPFEAYWSSQTDQVDLLPNTDIECLFPDPSLAQNDDFADSGVQLMLGDSEAAGYKNDNSHADCANDILWIPDFFTQSSIIANGVCTYDNLDL